MLLAGCEAGFPKVVVRLGEGDTTAADSLRPFVIATDDAEATAAGVAVLRSGGSEFYGPHVAGPNGCTTVEIFAALRGVGRIMLDDGSGQHESVYRESISR